ncbi:MAG: hypothetical protein U0905_09280 [Pirellulales bacterium]
MIVIAFTLLVTAFGATGMRRLMASKQRSQIHWTKLQIDNVMQSALERQLLLGQNESKGAMITWSIQNLELGGGSPNTSWVLQSQWENADPSDPVQVVRIQLINQETKQIVQERIYKVPS